MELKEKMSYIIMMDKMLQRTVVSGRRVSGNRIIDLVVDHENGNPTFKRYCDNEEIPNVMDDEDFIAQWTVTLSPVHALIPAGVITFRDNNYREAAVGFKNASVSGILDNPSHFHPSADRVYRVYAFDPNARGQLVELYARDTRND